jgi:outer membrane immunogenic protein
MIRTIAILSCLLTATASTAGGLYSSDSTSLKDVPAQSHTWTGFYFGAHTGYSWSDAYFDDEGEKKPFDFDGGIIGGHLGYDIQRGNFVFGVVGDYTGLDNDDSYEFGNGNQERRGEHESLATLRARAGYAFDDYLAYATIGVAFVEGEIQRTRRNLQPAKDETFTSWVAGVGVERRLIKGVSLFVEYLHVGLDDDIKGAGGFDEGPFVFEEIDIVKVGVSFRLQD